MKDQFENRLNDLYSAEDYFVKILPEMLAQIENEKLRKTLTDQLEITRHSERVLLRVTDQLKLSKEVVVSKALEAMIEDVEGLLSRKSNGKNRDAEIIAAAHRVVIYEIAGYITLYTYAEELCYDSIADTFQKALDETYRVGATLKEIIKKQSQTEAA